MLQEQPRPFLAEIPDEIRDRAVSRRPVEVVLSEEPSHAAGSTLTRTRDGHGRPLLLCAECDAAVYLDDAAEHGWTVANITGWTPLGTIDLCSTCTASHATSGDRKGQPVRRESVRKAGAVLAGAAVIIGAALLGVVAGLLIVGAVIVLLANESRNAS